MIRQINKDELPLCLDFIHLCFSTVAEKFGFTQENAPGHNAFMPLEKLENFWNWGFLMYGLFVENQNGENELAGYFSLSKDPDKTDTYVLHNLCVKPQIRKQGYGKALLDFAKDKVRELGGKIPVGCSPFAGDEANAQGHFREHDGLVLVEETFHGKFS